MQTGTKRSSSDGETDFLLNTDLFPSEYNISEKKQRFCPIEVKQEKTFPDDMYHEDFSIPSSVPPFSAIPIGIKQNQYLLDVNDDEDWEKPSKSLNDGESWDKIWENETLGQDGKVHSGYGENNPFGKKWVDLEKKRRIYIQAHPDYQFLQMVAGRSSHKSVEDILILDDLDARIIERERMKTADKLAADKEILRQKALINQSDELTKQLMQLRTEKAKVGFIDVEQTKAWTLKTTLFTTTKDYFKNEIRMKILEAFVKVDGHLWKEDFLLTQYKDADAVNDLKTLQNALTERNLPDVLTKDYITSVGLTNFSRVFYTPRSDTTSTAKIEDAMKTDLDNDEKLLKTWVITYAAAAMVIYGDKDFFKDLGNDQRSAYYDFQFLDTELKKIIEVDGTDEYTVYTKLKEKQKGRFNRIKDYKNKKEREKREKEAELKKNIADIAFFISKIFADHKTESADLLKKSVFDKLRVKAGDETDIYIQAETAINNIDLLLSNARASDEDIDKQIRDLEIKLEGIQNGFLPPDSKKTDASDTTTSSTENVFGVDTYKHKSIWGTASINTGVLKLNADIVTAIEDAHHAIVKHVPRFRDVPYERWQRDELTKVEFAQLVAHHLAITELDFPTTYMRDKEMRIHSKIIEKIGWIRDTLKYNSSKEKFERIN
jgi:hypothetical protein